MQIHFEADKRQQPAAPLPLPVFFLQPNPFSRPPFLSSTRTSSPNLSISPDPKIIQTKST